MNKKQEALRRGLRSFIEDTSKELADLEGRPLRPPPDPHTAENDAASAADAAADSGPERAAPEGVTPEVDEADSLRHDVPPGRVAAPAPPSARAGTMAGPAPPVAQRGTPPTIERQAPPAGERDAPPAVRHEAPPTVPHHPPSAGRKERESESQPVAAPEPPARRYSDVPAQPSQAEKPKRRAQAPVRRRPRSRTAEIGANGVSPAQVHARKGVCFAYFLNHECWRVTDAYCNSALQVCITRECPIYHLHKEAFERRFSRKFKHFW